MDLSSGRLLEKITLKSMRFPLKRMDWQDLGGLN